MTEPVDCWELLRIALAAAEMSGASGANCLVDALHEVLAYHKRAEEIEQAAARIKAQWDTESKVSPILLNNLSAALEDK